MSTTRSEPDSERSTVLVWIDAREAIVARWVDGAAQVGRVTSEVPAHRHSTGHVRHDPTVRHGGGGSSQTSDEPRRLEHLARFLDEVMEHLPVADDLVILGPGTVREHLAGQVLEADVRRGPQRLVSTRPAAPMTEHQLVARLRTLVGAAPRRRSSRTSVVA